MSYLLLNGRKQRWVFEGHVAIAHVRNNTHFVLITGWDSNGAEFFYVNDPGFDQESYDYTDISDVILYDVEHD